MVTSAAQTGYATNGPGVESASASGVSWGAIFAGAAAAAAISLILLVLGTGLGLAAASPWSATASTATALGVSAIVWLAFMSIAASAIGGYLTGRLRVKWANVHGDEVYFRDTAHGLLAWAVATLVTAAFLTSAIGGALGNVAQAGGEVAKGVAGAVGRVGQGAAQAAGSGDASSAMASAAYSVDALFRTDAAAASAPDPNDAQMRAEVGRIVVTSLRNGSMSPDDRRYVALLVAKRTGVAPADAEKRVDDAYNRASKAIADAENAAKQGADKARKAAQYGALWMFVALLAGAFVASHAALHGGRRRDGLS